MKPIEPGCVCVIVAHPEVLPANVGRMVVVVEEADPRRVPALLRLVLGQGRYWMIKGVASALHSFAGPCIGETLAHESCLRRLDDDPDAAEPRIAEREVEHV